MNPSMGPARYQGGPGTKRVLEGRVVARWLKTSRSPSESRGSSYSRQWENLRFDPPQAVAVLQGQLAKNTDDWSARLRLVASRDEEVPPVEEVGHSSLPHVVHVLRRGGRPEAALACAYRRLRWWNLSQAEYPSEPHLACGLRWCVGCFALDDKQKREGSLWVRSRKAETLRTAAVSDRPGAPVESGHFAAGFTRTLPLCNDFKPLPTEPACLLADRGSTIVASSTLYHRPACSGEHSLRVATVDLPAPSASCRVGAKLLPIVNFNTTRSARARNTHTGVMKLSVLAWRRHDGFVLLPTGLVAEGVRRVPVVTRQTGIQMFRKSVRYSSAASTHAANIFVKFLATSRAAAVALNIVVQVASYA